MIDISRGRFWDKPWSLIDGCTPCSPGCDHCWSAGMAQRWGHFVDSDGNPFIVEGGKFTGQILTHPERLRIPIHTKSGRHNGKPTVYAIWNDLFHEAVPISFRHAVYDVMAACEKHTFLILTKRPKEMAEYLEDCGWFRHRWAEKNIGHIYHGLTVCNQQEADEKIPVFLQVPGKKFLSIEPMLGEIDIISFLPATLPALDRAVSGPRGDCLDAVILGGETGPGARPIKIEWVRSIRDQCQSAGVAFFLKSFGKYPPFGNYRLLDGVFHDELPWVKL